MRCFLRIILVTSASQNLQFLTNLEVSLGNTEEGCRSDSSEKVSDLLQEVFKKLSSLPDSGVAGADAGIGELEAERTS